MADLALLGLTVLWGTTFLLVNVTLEGTSAGVLLTLRFAVAAAAAGLVCLVRRDRPTAALLRDGFLLGASMFGGFALQTEGLRFTTPARSAFLTSLAVLIVPFLSRFGARRVVPAPAWVGVTCAVLGLAVLTEPFADVVSPRVRLGDALTIGCAAAFALQIVLTAELSARHPLASLTFVQLLVAFALSATVLLPFEQLRIRPGPALWAAVAYLGLVMTTGAYFVMNWGQRHTTAVRAALIFSMEPLFATIVSTVWGSEVLGPPVLLGGGLIVVGVVVGEVGSVWVARRQARASRDRPTGGGG